MPFWGQKSTDTRIYLQTSTVQPSSVPSTLVLSRHSNGPVLKPGRTPVSSKDKEKVIVKDLQLCAEWGYPLAPFELRLIIKRYLEKRKRTVSQFTSGVYHQHQVCHTLPHVSHAPSLSLADFANSFLKRHKDALATRLCQNIKRSRAAVSREIFRSYIANLGELQGVPPCNIINYDETNLCDDPGKAKTIFKRGCNHAEQIINSSKTSTSVIFAATGDGVLLPPYVDYKSTHLFGSWTEGSPPGTRYNRTCSGWFDCIRFEDWVKTVAIPYFRNKRRKDSFGRQPRKSLGSGLNSTLPTTRYRFRAFAPKLNKFDAASRCFIFPASEDPLASNTSWVEENSEWRQG